MSISLTSKWPLRLVLIAAASAACMAMPPAAISQAAATTVTYAGWGGIVTDAVTKGLFADADKQNIKVHSELHGAWAGIKAHLTSGAPGWDVADIGFARCEEASQANLLLPLDYTIIDRSKMPANMAHA